MVREELAPVTTSAPKWIVCFYLFCICALSMFLVIYLFWAVHRNVFFLKLPQMVIILLIVVLGIWFSIKVLSHSVTATSEGLKSENIFGQIKMMRWDEVVAVKRPRFGIPYDFTYVISSNNSKIFLIRSMRHYAEMIQLINLSAPNLQEAFIDKRYKSG